MKPHGTTEIRNIGLAGHSAAGKTSLAEAILFSQKQTERLGSISAGTTVSDYDPEEIRRQHSINASLIPVEFKNGKINFLDMPGRLDFVGEIKNGIRASDGLVLVVDAEGKVDVGTEFVWEYADEFGVACRAAFVNKMDKERADFAKVLESLTKAFPVRVVAATLPVGAATGFKGVIDLIRMKFVEEQDRKANVADIPADMTSAAADARAKLVEAAAEGDDELMMKFLEDQPLSEEEVLKGLRGGMRQGRVLPVLCGSSTTLKGIVPLLTFIQDCFPSPLEGSPVEIKKNEAESPEKMSVRVEGPTALFVFKTVSDPYAGHLSFFKVMGGTVKSESALHNLNRGKSERLMHVLSVCGKKTENIANLPAGDLGAVAKLDSTKTNDTLTENADAGFLFTPTPLPQPTVQMAVISKEKTDADKIGIGIHRLMEQDPTLHMHRDPQIHQTILSGMGETHLDVAVKRLKEISKVEVELQIPKVPYRETITRKAEGQGKHKKQSGGHGQYGDCWVRFEPLPEGSGFQFEWAIVGGVIPTKFSPSIEKGLIESLEKGVLSRHPTVDLKAICYDGSYHTVDSSDMAFKVAASLAFKNVIPKAGPIILEPIIKATILVPEEFMGDIMGDLNSRRGRILGMTAVGKRQKIEALVPMSEMFTYSRDLRSRTRGSGTFETTFDHYERVPGEVTEKIVAEAQKEKEATE